MINPLRLDIQGGEKFLPFAKKKLRQLKNLMKDMNVETFNQRIKVDDGSSIFVQSIPGMDFIRIRGVSQGFYIFFVYIRRRPPTVAVLRVPVLNQRYKLEVSNKDLTDSITVDIILSGGVQSNPKNNEHFADSYMGVFTSLSKIPGHYRPRNFERNSSYVFIPAHSPESNPESGLSMVNSGRRPFSIETKDDGKYLEGKDISIWQGGSYENHFYIRDGGGNWQEIDYDPRDIYYLENWYKYWKKWLGAFYIYSMDKEGVWNKTKTINHKSTKVSKRNLIMDYLGGTGTLDIEEIIDSSPVFYGVFEKDKAVYSYYNRNTETEETAAYGDSEYTTEIISSRDRKGTITWSFSKFTTINSNDNVTKLVVGDLVVDFTLSTSSIQVYYTTARNVSIPPLEVVYQLTSSPFESSYWSLDDLAGYYWMEASVNSPPEGWTLENIAAWKETWKERNPDAAGEYGYVNPPFAKADTLGWWSDECGLMRVAWDYWGSVIWLTQTLIKAENYNGAPAWVCRKITYEETWPDPDDFTPIYPQGSTIQSYLGKSFGKVYSYDYTVGGNLILIYDYLNYLSATTYTKYVVVLYKIGKEIEIAETALSSQEYIENGSISTQINKRNMVYTYLVRKEVGMKRIIGIINISDKRLPVGYRQEFIIDESNNEEILKKYPELVSPYVTSLLMQVGVHMGG